jgi:serine/threonine protein kinase
MGDPKDAMASGGEDSLFGRMIADRYLVEARLGRGGMGALYRAHDTTLDRRVAVKVLNPALVAEPTVAQRFDREALAISRLDHPNVVRVFDAGAMPDGGKFIVMQLLEGRELREVIAEGPLTPARAVDFAVQVLRALEHAHRRGLVHRDLKPENVFIVVDDDGREIVKLVDFGIVKLLSGDDQKLTRAGLVFGTPRYMSPEQVAGGKIDERTDLYAVGVVLFEMLTGAPPFDADQAGMLMRMHVLSDVPPLPESVPSDVRAVVLRLLEKTPTDRFASAREVLDALAAASLVPAPRPAPSPRPAPRPTPMPMVAAPVSSPPLHLPDPYVPRSRNRPSALAAVVAALFVVALLVGMVFALSAGCASGTAAHPYDASDTSRPERR